MVSMMAVMGYVPDMSLGKNPHCIVPLPNIKCRFEGHATKIVEN
jgi:hypothetical protein